MIDCFGSIFRCLSVSLFLSQPRPRSSSPETKKKHETKKKTASSSSVGGGGGGSIGGGNGGGGGGGGSGGGGSSSGGSSDNGSFLSFLSGLWPAYLSLLASSPLATKSATAAALNAAGDASAQLLIEKRGVSELDWARLGRFTLLGGALVGPALHWWYGTLSRVVTLQGTAGALARLGLDQLAFAPVNIVF